MRNAQKSGQLPEKQDRKRGSQLRSNWARRQLVVVLIVPVVVPVREVHVVHVGRVVRVLRARPVPMGVVGATSVSMAIS